METFNRAFLVGKVEGEFLILEGDSTIHALSTNLRDDMRGFVLLDTVAFISSC